MALDSVPDIQKHLHVLKRTLKLTKSTKNIHSFHTTAILKTAILKMQTNRELISLETQIRVQYFMLNAIIITEGPHMDFEHFCRPAGDILNMGL